MRAIIIDDERLARKELNTLLSEYPSIKVVGESHNADHAKKNIEALKPDLIFLDIQMPAKTGFDLLEELSFVPRVVFTTAYDSYALKAFEVNAFDYLLKPFDKSRFIETVNKAIESIKKRKDIFYQEKISELSKYVSSQNKIENPFSNKFPVQKRDSGLACVISPDSLVKASCAFAKLVSVLPKRSERFLITISVLLEM